MCKWYNFLVEIFQKSSTNFLERYKDVMKDSPKEPEGIEKSMNDINKALGLPPVGEDKKNPYRY